MGGEPSKIKDNVRIKIYKRVKLIDAAERCSLMMKSNPSFQFSPMKERPVSLNFSAKYSTKSTPKKIILYLTLFDHVGDIGDNSHVKYLEVDGANCPFLLCHILCYASETTIENKEEINTFVLGLSKRQYDLLFQ